MKKLHMTKGSIFDDLGFDPVEAANLKIRAALMMALDQEILKLGLTQEEAAKTLGVTQPRMSNLKSGKIHLFTIDMLVNMLAKLHKPVAIIIDDRLAA